MDICPSTFKLSSDLYKNYDGIVGVVIRNGDKLRLIDGYHRYVSALEQKNSTIQVLVGE